MCEYLDVIAEHQLWTRRTPSTTSVEGCILQFQGQVASQDVFDASTLESLLDAGDTAEQSGPAGARSLRVIYIKDKIALLHPTIWKLLHEKCGMTAKFAMDCTNQFTWTHFPTESSMSKSLLVIQYGFWVWKDESAASYVQLLMNSRCSTYICVGHPKELQDLVRDITFRDPRQASNPLFIDVLIMESVLSSYRSAISQYRDVLRDIEQDNAAPGKGKAARDLHDVSLRWHTIRKDLGDLEQHIRHMHKLSQDPKFHGSRSIATNCFQTLEDSCTFWSRWVSTYLERTNTRINLLQHLAAQKTSLDTQLDSISMSTLALVTVLFLPGTFICSVLSTDFFSYSEFSVAVSRGAWVLPAAMIPATFVVVVGWWAWFQYRAHTAKIQLLSDGSKEV